jgi:hypothetical protein
MRVRPAPPVATWFLKLFCSGPEHESAIGDLMEKFQQGHGHFWYWRQVIGLVVFGCYRNAGRRSLELAKRIPLKEGTALVLSLAVSSALLLSALWPLILITTIGGVVIAVLLASFGGHARIPDVHEPRIARIDSSKITAGGGAGAGLLIVFLLASVLYELPLLRIWASPGLLLGVVFAAALRFWRKFHPRDITKDWISIKPR